PVERLLQLAMNYVGKVVRCMPGLADDDDGLAHAGFPQPLAENLLGFAGAVDPGGVECVPALLEEGVEQWCGRAERVEILEAERHAAHRLVEAGDRESANRRGSRFARHAHAISSRAAQFMPRRRMVAICGTSNSAATWPSEE